ncbi:single-stranded DNA-binding protein [Neisseria sp. Ec49-e6-T10]|uniref:single-stranded DNA-binding protein n=1 Tax=Neisseria sp. Ec49-e6-T10 TaxID=3140744 RepID=UPI003EBB1440
MSTQVVITGTLGAAPVFKAVPVSSGKRAGEVSSVIEFSVRTEINQKLEDGTYRTLSEEWRSCEYWHPNAEHFASVLKKGTPIMVMGTEYVREYDAKDGSGKRVGRRVRVDALGVHLNARVEGITLRAAQPSESVSEDIPEELPDDPGF